MLLTASIALVVLLTSYCIYYTYKNRKKLTCMAGMMIAMTVGMMSSITAGTVLGILLDRDLTLSVIAAVTIGMAAGYAAGKPVTLMAAMDGLTAGVMGGMMGAMLGVMLLPDSSYIMVLFVNGIFIVIMLLLIQLIEEETRSRKKEEVQMKKPLIASPVFLVPLLLVMGVIGWQQAGHITGSSVQSGSLGKNSIGPADVTVDIGPNGYTPADVELKAGTPATINFRTEPTVGCLIQLVSPKLGINQFLDEGKDNYIALGALEPGTYDYSCGMNMFQGRITVK